MRTAIWKAVGERENLSWVPAPFQVSKSKPSCQKENIDFHWVGRMKLIQWKWNHTIMFSAPPLTLPPTISSSLSHFYTFEKTCLLNWWADQPASASIACLLATLLWIYPLILLNWLTLFLLMFLLLIGVCCQVSQELLPPQILSMFYPSGQQVKEKRRNNVCFSLLFSSVKFFDGFLLSWKAAHYIRIERELGGFGGDKRAPLKWLR